MKVVVSGCLLGYNCKYNGLNNYADELCNFLDKNNFEVFPVCPEVMGGLPTPRIPSEIIDGKVFMENGKDVTNNYIKGANEALEIALVNGCNVAILKSKSPSCGYGEIYDGSFSHKLKKGNGIACQLFLENNIRVYTEKDFKNLKDN